eukprot:scaffold4049_cov204-Alexandrium_tamarense.AAC.4
MSPPTPTTTTVCNTNVRCRRRFTSFTASFTLLYLQMLSAISVFHQICLVRQTSAFMTPIRRQTCSIHVGRNSVQLQDDTIINSDAIRDDDEEDVRKHATIQHGASTSATNNPAHSSSSSSSDDRHHANGDKSHTTTNHREDLSNNERETYSEATTLKPYNVVSELVGLSEKILDNLDPSSPTSSPTPPKERVATTNTKSFSSLARLSKAHQSMMAKTSNMRRQRFVTGKYPLYVSVKQNPTKKWLGLAESQIYLNGTSIDKSLASYDIFNWLDDEERRELHGDYEFLSLELLAEIHVRKPGYVNILPKGGAGSSLLRSKEGDDGVFGWKSWKLRDDITSNFNLDEEAALTANDEDERLWITGFSLTKQRGELHTVDVETGTMSNVNERTARAIKWPNEVASIPRQSYADYSNDTTVVDDARHNELEDALLVTDGFLVPGKDKGGLYVVRNPGNSVTEWRVCLTGVTNLQDITINAEGGDWFYHR